MFGTGVGGRCTYFRYVFIQDIQGILPVAHPFQCVSCLQYIVVVVCVRQKGKCNINSGKSTMYDESMANSSTYCICVQHLHASDETFPVEHFSVRICTFYAYTRQRHTKLRENETEFREKLFIVRSKMSSPGRFRNANKLLM